MPGTWTCRREKLPCQGRAELERVGAIGREEWKRGWRLVLACCIGFSFFSLLTHTMGMFMQPIGKEFGWSRTLLSAGVTISGIATALLSPPFGILIDRFGSRRLALPGIVVTAFAVSLIALANGSAVQWMRCGLFTRRFRSR